MKEEAQREQTPERSQRREPRPLLCFQEDDEPGPGSPSHEYVHMPGHGLPGRECVHISGLAWYVETDRVGGGESRVSASAMQK